MEMLVYAFFIEVPYSSSNLNTSPRAFVAITLLCFSPKIILCHSMVKNLTIIQKGGSPSERGAVFPIDVTLNYLQLPMCSRERSF